MARRTPRGQATRERILDTALSLFAERGYARVSVEEIAETAGVTKGAVYHWFSDKDDIGRELQHDLYERLTARSLVAMPADGDTITSMLASFHAYLAALGDLGEARFFLRDAWVIPALDEAGRADHEAAVGMVRGVLAGAMQCGEIVALDPDALARILMGAWAEATLHVLRSGDRAGSDAVIVHLLESLRPAGRPATKADHRTPTKATPR
jgi:AcrR family transcriptional regulator